MEIRAYFVSLNTAQIIPVCRELINELHQEEQSYVLDWNGDLRVA